MQDPNATLDRIYRSESRRALATLIRALGDFDLAEDALQEAFAIAAQDWPSKGIPNDPVAWLISVGRFRAIDKIRRDAKLRELNPELVAQFEDHSTTALPPSAQEIEDDPLRLIFTCCHPAIDPKLQVPLTLREVCGLTTQEIAEAFLVSPTTMAQRLVRGKAKIRKARIPFAIPSVEDMPERLDAALTVIYLVFNEGYSATSGSNPTRVELTTEAIRLGRLLLDLLPEPEIMGLLAMMLLHESRRESRVDANGDIVLLEDQDRARWNPQYIEEGQRLVKQALASGRFGPYTIQAAISAVHSEAREPSDTDWPQIVALYNVLFRINPSPVVALNRAVAIAMRDGPQAGLGLIDQILDNGELADYGLAHSARGELLRRLGDIEQAREAFQTAMRLAKIESDRRFLATRLAELTPMSPL